MPTTDEVVPLAQHDATLEHSPFSAYAVYPEFAGPGGERYLKKLLRQILPMALYRTWEIFVEHQARGNDCYLSISQLAAFAGRSLRTMQKNVAELAAKRLLVERAERKSFSTAQGEHTSRMVVVKDFASLYALAHEYHLWLHTDAYIPPDRIFAESLSQDPSLVAKLRRFNTYRRVLYTHLPGPGPQAHEEDRWFCEYREYQAEPPVPTRAAQETAADDQLNPGATTPTLSAKDAAKEVSKESRNEKNESSQRDGLPGDSFDSVPSFSEEPLRKQRTGNRNQEHKQTTGVMTGSAASERSPRSPGQKPKGTHHPATRESEGTSQEVPMAGDTRLIQSERSIVQHQDRQPHPPDYSLARSFLQEIAAPFGDRNLKGSTTRVLGIIANAFLEESEVLLCLVRAYTIARDTHTLRPAHSDPKNGRANRMPLFCTLFERFIQARIQNGRWNYSWQQMEDDLAADDRLLLWWTERQALLAKETPASCENQPVPVSSAQQDQNKSKEAYSSTIGWACQEDAHTWGEQLLEALTTGGYEAEVRVHLEGRRYQIMLVGEGYKLGMDTQQQVQFVIERLQQGDI